MQEPIRNVILTGFEPFGPYEHNPTQDLVKRYDGVGIGDVKVHGLVLPCTYHGAFEVLSEKIDSLKPEGVLNVGVDSNIPRIRFEMRGKNRMDGKYPDAEGMDPKGRPIVENGYLSYQTGFNPMRLAYDLIDRGINVDISFDANEFICNSLLYLTAGKIFLERLAVKHSFMHTPWTSDYKGRVDLDPSKVFIDTNTLDEVVEKTILRLS